MAGDFVQLERGKIYFQDVGTGEAIVFLHGFTLDHTMWVEQVEYFKARYRVITFDMRGFGKSSLPDTLYSYSKDLKSLLDYLKISKAHIVGLSLGGEEALNFTLDYPDYVLSLTLVSSSLGGYASTVDWDVKAKEVGIEAAKRNWLNHEVFRSTKAYPNVHTLLTEMVSRYSGWHWLNSGFRIRPPIPAIDCLKEINWRVLVVVGERDLTYYHEIADVLAKRIRNVRKIVVKDCGHMLTMENSILFNELLLAFLSSQ